MKIYLIFICLVAAAGGFLFGFDTSVISGVIEFIASPKVFNLNDIEKGWTVSCILIGCMAGCIFAGPLSDKYGRKKIFLFTALVFLVSSLGCALAGNHIIFIVYRIIAGVAVGAASMLSPIYIAEVSPAKHRGKLGIINILAIFIGQSAAFFSNFLLKDHGGANNWRWMMGIMVIPSAILFLLLFFIPESPRWLVGKQRNNEAYLILKKITGKGSVEDELSDIERSMHAVRGKLSELLKGKMFKLL